MTVDELAELEGCSKMDLLEEATFDSICPAICTNKGCDYQDELEPDAANCECPECGTNTVSSILIIEGLI